MSTVALAHTLAVAATPPAGPQFGGTHAKPPAPAPAPTCAPEIARSVVQRFYLSVYNWVSFFGWAQVLYYATLALLNGGHETVYAAVKLPLLFSQTAMLTEILHSILGSTLLIYAARGSLDFGHIYGFVRSPVIATSAQVGARTLVTWGIVWTYPETHSHILITSLVLSWSITEVVRYTFFGFREASGITPFWLPWLRYTTFTVLYPIGLISEVGLIFTAMPHMKGIMLSIWVPLTVLYIPGFPYMYRYMLSQRKKALSKAKTA